MSENPIDYEKGLTFEKVWATIQELGKKYDAIFEREAEERQREAEERKREAEERKREAEERQKETDKRLKKLDETVRKTSSAVAKLSEKVGKLDNRFGELIEHLVAPGTVELFNKLGYHFDEITHPFGRKFEKGKIVLAQADVVLENANDIMIIEIKSKPQIQHIRELIRKMEIIRQYYEQQPDSSNKKLIAALAGAIFPENVKKFTIKAGFYVITQSGDTLKIDVPKDFEPRIF
ncbi:MAG: hypothetical protein LBE12_04005 [Planctomycetaceae bacterium]|jgi:hypothetical protein|nr:hypothetical protein [Planctomycetaceae bacterium]